MNLLAVRPVYICETGFDPNMKEVILSQPGIECEPVMACRFHADDEIIWIAAYGFQY